VCVCVCVCVCVRKCRLCTGRGVEREGGGEVSTWLVERTAQVSTGFSLFKSQIITENFNDLRARQR